MDLLRNAARLSGGLPMKLLEIKPGVFAKIDDDNFYQFSKMKWHIQRLGYVVTRETRSSGAPRKTVFMHRIVVGIGDADPRDVDHIDRDKLNNQRSNLRPCSRAENVCNTNVRKDSTTGLKGVSRRKWGWCAYINYRGKRRHLGLFQSPELAFEFVSLARDLIHGEFANHGIRTGIHLDPSDPRILQEINSEYEKPYIACKNNKTGLRGVFLHKKTGKWKSSIQKDGKRRTLGYFKTPEEAHAAYRAAKEAML